MMEKTGDEMEKTGDESDRGLSTTIIEEELPSSLRRP